MNLEYALCVCVCALELFVCCLSQFLFLFVLCSYNAILHAAVHRLDSNPLITAVTCLSDSKFAIDFSDVSGVEALVPGTIMAGSSESWKCMNAAGTNVPFIKSISDVLGLTLSLRLKDGTSLSVNIGGASVPAFVHAMSRSGGSILTSLAEVGLHLPNEAMRDFADLTLISTKLNLHTDDVPPTACFEHMTLNYHRTAGVDEASLRRRLQV
jgi:hypothetical protein